MDYSWIGDYCLTHKGAQRDYKVEWEATRYMIGGKMFAMDGGDKAGRPIFTVKLEPLFSDLLRRQYPDVVVPGYYMNKDHWSSMYYAGEVPEETVREMIDQAYGLVLASLPKKTQKALLD